MGNYHTSIALVTLGHPSIIQKGWPNKTCTHICEVNYHELPFLRGGIWCSGRGLCARRLVPRS